MDKHLQEKHTETRRGLRYRYYVSSSADVDPSKPTLLLCHGWPDGAALWQFVVPLLAKSKLRIVAPDLLGYGGTANPTTPEHYNIRLMADDLVDILQTEKVDGPVIPVGHDWGSYMAQRFYLLETARCAGLITLCVAFQAPRPDKFDLNAFNAFTESTLGYPIYAYWEFFLAPDGPKLMEQHLESVWAMMHGQGAEWMKSLFCVRGSIRDFVEKDRKDVTLRPYAEDAALRDAWIKSTAASGFFAPCCWYRAMAENHQFEAEQTMARKVEKPYLFIGASEDTVCRTDFVYGPKQEGLLPDVTIHELDSGHWSPYEKPTEVANLILDWLKEKKFTD